MTSESILLQSPATASARIAYGRAPSQFGDLFLPDGPGPHPLVVAIHGGFWRAKYDLLHLGHLAAALAGQGLAVWSLEYRRVGESGGTWPGPRDDLLEALEAAPRLLAHRGVDTGRRAILGHSAGGHLAWVVAAPPVRAVVSLAGLGDLREAYEHHLSDDAVAGLLGATPEESPGLYDEASGAHRLPLKVPQLVVHGRQDDCVPFNFSQRWVQRAREAGDEVETLFFDGGHYEPIDPAWRGFPTIAAWLRERLV